MESTNPRSDERTTGDLVQAMFDQVDDMIRQDRAALPLLATVFGLLAYRCRQALGAWHDLETTSAAIPLKEIRRELGRVIQATEELNRLQESIPLPPEAELDAMIEGKLPVSEEAYVLALLQYSVLKLAAGGFGIRDVGYLLGAMIFRGKTFSLLALYRAMLVAQLRSGGGELKRT